MGRPTTRIEVVTVAHEYASGGSAFARRLGEALGWPVLDHDLVARVEARLRIAAHLGSPHARPRPPSREIVAATLQLAPAEVSLGVGALDELVFADGIVAAAREEIRLAAERAPLVVAAPGAVAVLGDVPGALHVALSVPLTERIVRHCARTGHNAPYAVAEVRRRDHEYATHLRRHHGIDVRDASLYDVVVNLARVGVEEAVEALVRLVRGRATLGVRAAI